jgi:hypothetical protein
LIFIAPSGAFLFKRSYSMSKITITINTDNDAFQNDSVDGMSHELPDILESLATYILENNELPEFVYDSNGNKCGSIVERA